LLTLTGVREQIVNGIPDCLKYSTAAGIGLFIAFVGLRNAKMVVAQQATFVGLGSFSDPQVQLAAFGLILTAILMARNVKGAIALGIVATALAGMLRGASQWPTQILSLPHPASTFLKLDLAGALRLGLLELMRYAYLTIA
jgi:AGZA family xanthine/uracil permease-like MFS transporter